MPADSSQAFYGRWARLYDVLSHSTPGLPALRASAVDTLDLDRGDTVVDLGCGSGPNVPHLRRAVSPDGRVVGVDFSKSILERARHTHDYENVEFLECDATRLPLDEPVDAIFASFLGGMLTDPVETVDGWADNVRPGGSLALLDASLSDSRLAWPLNQAVKGMVFASSPEKSRDWRTAPWNTVTRRVKLAHAEIRSNSSDTIEQTWLVGTVRVTTGTVE